MSDTALDLFAAVACALLIACAKRRRSAADHAAGRHQELATRIALGATRAPLVRQAVTEGLVLGVAAGRPDYSSPGGRSPRSCCSLLRRSRAWMKSGSIPACFCSRQPFLFWSAWRVDWRARCRSTRELERSLRAMGAGRSGRTARFRQLLTVAEIALALMLVVAAGLSSGRCDRSGRWSLDSSPKGRRRGPVSGSPEVPRTGKRCSRPS